MKLKEFTESFVCRNSLIRLWYPVLGGGHRMVAKDDDRSVCMEWELIKGEGLYKLYVDHEVIGVTDILCDDSPEAINIVIEEWPLDMMRELKLGKII
jgi:hypothetical protein